jgi:hypothetical protein
MIKVLQVEQLQAVAAVGVLVFQQTEQVRPFLLVALVAQAAAVAVLLLPLQALVVQAQFIYTTRRKMANFAVINGNAISNVIVADDAETALKYGGGTEVLETTGKPWIGWVRVDGVWINPDALEADDESSSEA